MLEVDFREREMFKFLDKNEVTYEAKELPVADYIYGNIGIERKDWKDFIGSLKDGKVFRQVEQIELNFEKPIIVIIGNFAQRFYHPHFKYFSDEQLVGSLRVLAMNYPKTKIIHLDTNGQFAKFLKNIIKSIEEPKEKREHYEGLKINNDLPLGIKLLCQVEGISIKTARKIFENYNLFSGIKVDEHKLQEIDGIGKKLSERIKNSFENV